MRGMLAEEDIQNLKALSESAQDQFTAKAEEIARSKGISTAEVLAQFASYDVSPLPLSAASSMG